MTMLTSTEFDTIRVMNLTGPGKKCLPAIYFSHTHIANMFSIYLIDACIHKIFGINRLKKPVHFRSLCVSVLTSRTPMTVFYWNILMKQSFFPLSHMILKEMTNFECTMNKVWFKLLAKLRKKNHSYTRTHKLTMWQLVLGCVWFHA